MTATINNKNQNERKVMNDQFDDLAKNVAQSATRRQALKKFGVGLAAVALAALGLANEAEAKQTHKRFKCQCKPPHWGCTTQDCFNACALFCT
jgi:hypothetical protein